MTDKMEHQTSHTQYQIRINGAGVRFYTDMHKNMMTEFAAIARDNPKLEHVLVFLLERPRTALKPRQMRYISFLRRQD